MIVVVRPGGERHEYLTAGRFVTEEIFNNLCLHDGDANLIAVFAQDQWACVQIEDDEQTRQA